MPIYFLYRYLLQQMSGHSKLGLRNASNFLNILRRKYAREAEESTLLHNKTFMEEESLELYENVVREESSILSPAHSKSKGEPPIDALSEIKPPPKTETTFCDRLITANLEQTLAIYQQDLQILTENKLFLEEKLEVMAEKIRKLRELETSNQLLAAENDRSKEFLAELVREYHDSLHLLFRSQLQQQEAFNSARNKIRMLLKEVGEDYYYIGFVEHWNTHIETLQRQHKQVQARIKEDSLAEQQRAKEEPVKPLKVVAVTQKERRGEEDEFLAPDEPKPKKRLSQSEKASLLGDLKSFAKNFKFPSG